MQALQFSATGSLDHLQLRELPMPVPGVGEVLVEVRASALNPSDVKNVLGRFDYTTLPRVPGRDFAGVVVQGPEALLGRAVWGGTGRGFGFDRDGCHASHVALPADAVTPKPAILSFAQAASCGVPFLTAWDALERGGVGAGTRLLILGAGAVARAARVLARARAADVVVAARRAAVVRALQDDGNAFELLPDAALAQQARQAFGELPEVVFDTTGFLLPAAVESVARFGRVVVIAAPAEGLVSVPVLALYRRGGAIVGVNSLLHELPECAAMLSRIGALFAQGALPLPDGLRELPLAQGPAAYREVAEGCVDKIILTPQ